jgi:N-acetylneuraminic acid mutarotase
MHTARSQHIAMLIPGGKVLVVGGWNANDTLSYPLASAEVYDPGTGTWAAAHDMLEATSVQTATLLANGRVLVVGGTYEPPTPESVSPHEGIAATAELYDPVADEWTMTGNLGKTVRGCTATLLSDGRVLVTGGMDRPWTGNVPASASAAVYDPSTGTWGATSDMLEGRSEHTATPLPDGRVLVAGGIIGLGEAADGPGNLGLRSTAELYDPGSP